MKNKKLTLILVTLLFAVSFMTAQETKGKTTIVVIPFDTKDVEANDAEVFFEVLTNEIAGTGKFKVVDRSSVDKIKEEHKFQNSEWSNDAKVAELGKALNANMVATGKIMSYEKNWVVTLRTLDVNTMEIISPATMEVSSLSEFFNKIPDLVKKLIKENGETETTEGELSPKQENLDFSLSNENIPFISSNKKNVALEWSDYERSEYYKKLAKGWVPIMIGIIGTVAGGIVMALPWIIPEWRENENITRQACFISCGIFCIELPAIICIVWGGLNLYVASYSVAVRPSNDDYKNNKR